MKHIEEIFGGENAEEQNVLLHIIKERGYEFFEKTPKTTMTVRLLEDLHELGYEIQPKAKNHVVLDNVIASDFLTKRKFSLTNSLRAFFKKNPNTWKRCDGSHFKYGAAMQYGYDLAVRKLKKHSL